jgi:3-oxoacyl-[acyl-carrier protein] reductase
VEGTVVAQQLMEEQMLELGAATPMGRLVRPEDVARTVAFFAGEDAGFTTGHYIPVNGGAAMD